MRAPLCADGTAFHHKCDLAKIAGLDGTAEALGDRYTPKPDVETIVERGTYGYQTLFISENGENM